ncbi:hypothetical protein PHLGIDRAFT_119442 [Phlebiopsis gigantea 11061_1 CR5-6]|uniref:DUF221-domain-containing protein n=1 Tax=Phlebiopsis gigantea (strain 11061_1 CR5-6) TaxID=745531 RepID=A0A0C3NLI7_PHLG1|nr:hypothetical protein PHLGIDRAFT_119442 [Phlebiopsis gigantea 11061_1 CR5-6]
MSQVTPDKAKNTDSQTFLTALVTNAAVLGIELVAFVFLKHRLGRIYAPRTYLPPPDKRAVNLPNGWWKWLLAIVAVPTGDVLRKNGMDAYMFLRFIRLLVILFASITILSCGILLPVDTAGLHNASGTDKLAQLSWGNIPKSAQDRYAAHLVVTWISTFWALYLIRRELKHYARTRQEFLISPSHSCLAQARTVLITNVPPELCNEHDLRRWASFVPGGVQDVWLYRDTKSLNTDYKERLKVCKKLEKATSKLIRSVVKAKGSHDKVEDQRYRKEHKSEWKQRQAEEATHEKEQRREHKAREKEEKKEHKALDKRRKEGEEEARRVEEEYLRSREIASPKALKTKSRSRDVGRPSADTTVAYTDPSAYDDVDIGFENHPDIRPHRGRTTTGELEAGRIPSTPPDDTDPARLLELHAPPEKRPKHRLGFLGLFGKKVDTIEWCKDEIARLNASIDEKRGALANADTMPPPLGSAFIQCNLQMGAHILAQCVSYDEPLMMAQKWIEVSPKDVIWDNIDDSVYETRFRYITSWIGSIVLIIIWFAPVAFVGTLSNVATLCEKVSWLCWIRDSPTPVPGIIQGILPPLFLAILFAILPWLLKGLAWYENIPRWSLLSISVYKRYFLFLVIHGFLVVTLSSGFTTVASQIIEQPTQTVSALAQQLPSAAIFFLTWTLTQGLTGAGSALLQVGQLIGHYVKKWLLGRTPRQAYQVGFKMPKADFGLVLPRISLLATIALAYSVLSPIINPLATVSFMLFFFSWKFLLTWVFDQPDESETGGLYFPLAINFLFVGLYIEQICIAVLFFLKISDGIIFVVEGILMVLLIGLTLTAQILFKRSFDPITQYLPMSLATKQVQERWEREQKRHRLDVDQRGAEDMDLFSHDRLVNIIHRRIRNPVKKLAVQAQKNAARMAMVAPSGSLKVEDTQLEYSEGHADSLSDASVSGGEQTTGRPTARRAEAVRRRRYGVADDDGDVGHLSDPRTRSPGASEEDGEDKDFDVHGFDHPSTYEAQPWIWVPRDALGLSKILVREYEAAGVEASDEGSEMDRKGGVEVSRGPPDEEWAGGYDA